MEKLKYKNLRTEIKLILADFLLHEIECFKDGEFDIEFIEFMEFKTDDVLQLIKRQGGTLT